jgi:hypothetical protein
MSNYDDNLRDLFNFKDMENNADSPTSTDDNDISNLVSSQDIKFILKILSKQLPMIRRR